ncbi:unnamed protein product [Caretta caretta]
MTVKSYSYINSLADEAEDRLKYNNLHPAYRAITCLAGSHKQPSNILIMKPDGSPSSLTDEVLDRWKTHYKGMLNHRPADECLALRDLANCTAADPGTNTDPLSL